jgi:hydroxypyruvate reductase/glycerate 2-kinase
MPEFPLIALLRQHARAIWQAAVDAAEPRALVRTAFADPALGLGNALAEARRILVLGAGKAGAAMTAGVVEALADYHDRLGGLVNVPEDALALQASAEPIHLHAARPASSNHPTAVGVAGARRILELAGTAGPDDVGLCLLSGGGSALLPCPVAGVSLEDKQKITALLHTCGATINEMNAVRKHLSAIKGGRLAEAFTGKSLYSLIISDVIGDPLDVIASGPTAADSTTFADALAVLERYQLTAQAPPAVLEHLRRGAAGQLPETPKSLPQKIHNHILGNNGRSLTAAARKAETLGYQVLNLGSFIEGETQAVAKVLAAIVRSVRRDGVPHGPPACLLSGGETTVTLAPAHGLGGRNQEFVLAALAALSREEVAGLVILSGGTDGEDGPTDAAGAVADEETLRKAAGLGLDPQSFLAQHDAYHFFKATGDLLQTGLTQTNVMDVRVILVNRPLAG